tara:strand:+ start:982 stop:1488 length:507 start_codon:yes stop_codon:yes gene_type:complete
MNYIVVDGSMVISGQKDDGTLLYTPITPRTEPMLVDSEKDAVMIAAKSGSRATVWSDEDYANGAGVVAAGPKVGEVREDSVRRVCINPNASYGGGSGTLWAVEGQEAQLTTDDYPHGYIRGECVKISDEGLSISFRITDLMEEQGEYVMGAVFELPIGKIRRYDRGWF